MLERVLPNLPVRPGIRPATRGASTFATVHANCVIEVTPPIGLCLITRPSIVPGDVADRDLVEHLGAEVVKTG